MDYQARILPTRDAIQRLPYEGAQPADIEGIELMLNFVAASDRLRSVVYAPLAEKGVSEGKFSLLMALFGEGPLGTLKLSERIGVKPATVSVMVKRMLADDAPLIAVESCETDRRERIISLTDAGRAFLKGALPAHLERVRRFSALFSGEERETLIGFLKKLQNG